MIEKILNKYNLRELNIYCICVIHIYVKFICYKNVLKYLIAFDIYNICIKF